MCWAMCSASSSTRNDPPITTSSIASSKSSGKRDMWTPFWAGSRSTVQSISAGMSFSTPPNRSWIAFRTRVTPARDSPIRTSGEEACRSVVRRFRLASMASTEDTFARLVSLAVHDLRTPLATVSGFARTLERTTLGDPADKYVQMMVAASNQLAELLEDVALAARIESGRWEPNVQPVDSLELARDAAAAVEGAHAEGTGVPVRVDRDAAETALRQLARCALRHGGLQELDLTISGPEIAIAPVTDAAGPILLAQEARDLGALIAGRLVRALGGTVELEADRLLVRLPAQ